MKPMERNPVILSLQILKEMGITEEQHPKFPGEWAPLWNALVAYRGSIPSKEWTTALMPLLSGGKGAKKYRNEQFDALDHQLDVIYTKATS